jgi:hypothetical protein
LMANRNDLLISVAVSSVWCPNSELWRCRYFRQSCGIFVSKSDIYIEKHYRHCHLLCNISVRPWWSLYWPVCLYCAHVVMLYCNDAPLQHTIVRYHVSIVHSCHVVTLRFQHVTCCVKVHYVAKLFVQAVNVIDVHSVVTWAMALLVLSVNTNFWKDILTPSLRLKLWWWWWCWWWSLQFAAANQRSGVGVGVGVGVGRNFRWSQIRSH